MYSTNKERKSVVVERFSTLKSKFYKCMTLISKNMCIVKLHDIVNKCHNTYDRAIKMNPNNVKWSTCVSKFKKTVVWAYVISDLNGRLFVGMFYKKELQQENRKSLDLER